MIGNIVSAAERGRKKKHKKPVTRLPVKSSALGHDDGLPDRVNREGLLT